MSGTGASGAPMQRRLDVQGLRAVAVLMVVVFHAGLPFPGGFVGVDVFFVISGFVITAMLQRTWQTTGTIRFRDFYFRRFKRLTPALALTVSVTLLAGAALLSPLEAQSTAALTGLGAILFSANYVISRTTGGYFDAPAETNPLLHTWSLSVEEQFYFFFPLLLLISFLIGKRQRFGLKFAPLIIVSAVTVVSFIGAYVFTAAPGESSRFLFGFYNPATRVWEFAIGALVVFLINEKSLKLIHKIAPLLGFAGVAALIASLFLIDGSTRFPGPWTLLPVMGTVLLILAGFAPGNQFSKVLETMPMVRIGDWSYSIYLWHWPFIVFASLLWPENSSAVLVAAILSIIPAIVSYYLVEQPIRSLPSLNVAKTTGLIASVIIVPLILVAGLWFAQSNQWWNSNIEEFSAASVKPAGVQRGCTSQKWDSGKPDRCTWNKEATGKPIYLVGDSNADHFIEGIIGAGEELDRPVLGLSVAACRFTQGNSRKGCDEAQSRIMDYLKVATPGTVVISDRISKDEEFLINRIRELQVSGHEAVLVKPIPQWEEKTSWNPWACSTLEMATNGCNKSMTLESLEATQGPFQDRIERAGKATNSTIVETWDTVCPTGTCFIQSDGIVRFRDGTHISIQQSRKFAPVFFEALARD